MKNPDYTHSCETTFGSVAADSIQSEKNFIHEVVENIEFLRIKRCREACERNQGLRFLLEETVFRPNTILKLAARTFGSARHGKPASIATPNKLFVIVLLVTVA